MDWDGYYIAPNLKDKDPPRPLRWEVEVWG